MSKIEFKQLNLKLPEPSLNWKFKKAAKINQP